MSTVQDPNRKPEEEISRLAEKYQLSLLRLCFAYLHDRTLAEDTVQETFLKAYHSISSFRNESSEKTWLSHIAINCCRDKNKSAWARFFDRRITPDMLPAPSENGNQSYRKIQMEICLTILFCRRRRAERRTEKCRHETKEPMLSNFIPNFLNDT